MKETEVIISYRFKPEKWNEFKNPPQIENRHKLYSLSKTYQCLAQWNLNEIINQLGLRLKIQSSTRLNCTVCLPSYNIQTSFSVNVFGANFNQVWS